MRNPDATRQKILKKSGDLFNTQGYKATSISDITDATGLTKGAIYRHFKNKAVLEKETLFHLSSLMFDEVRNCIKGEQTAGDKLRAIFRYYESYVNAPAVKGGCPLLNVAVEADDAHPELRKGAIKVLDILHQSLVTILENGIKHKQLRKNIDLDYYSSLIIAALEGAIMMSKLRGNNDDIKRVTKHLDAVLKEIEL